MAEKFKICMLGASGVGKTSLVKRFVHRAFSETYRTTIGVAIEKKRSRCDDRDVDLVIWDLSGEDEFQSVTLSYVRGAAGILLCIDTTRRDTALVALRLAAATRAMVGDVPSVCVLTKSDLIATWDLDAGSEAALRRAGCALVRTSAKTGEGVEDAFGALTRAVLSAPRVVARGP